MGAGNAPRSDVERQLAGPPIDSSCGPMWIGAEAKARAVKNPAETPSPRSWLAALALKRASTFAPSWHRLASSPFSPSRNTDQGV
ncbi:hypothetical protein HYC85_027820 [Camellia sinensis]|uniref:Uncharacterized protein n=1 Tax=Camellia sinensis TaxID=4442 RepID=A0A7J7FTN9_CAMSI|nr:hypothetical protein HYC85_027820 [Camellia sinensis]